MAQESKDSGPVSETLPDAPAPAKPSVKSFKQVPWKKYAKLKLKFELALRESESLIREELRIEDLSKRIQEQNDQLLEVLMEFNESIHVPSSLRYDLNLPDDPPPLHAAEQEITPLVNDETLARTALKEAKSGLASGSLSPSAYRQVEESIKRNKAFAPGIKYSDLLKIQHSGMKAPGNGSKEADALDHKLGYMTPEHEADFYLALDAKLGDEAAETRLARMPNPPTFAEREKEASMRNPASVFNWLRRNQPHTLQEHEATSDKSARPANSRSSKRAPAPRKEEDTIDEDGAEVEPTPKGKRKRDDDTGYRPKGGSSRSKKKKEDATPRNSKKA
ncbi:uncharacterized protein N7483_007794 [Penicillium malachiteum]|uniref:uncharacterized protein n=1 Tax=Penicillium malachiteum TaxID=1324776 RepID=UPI002546D805|nr:uncharacterized protein N7483_007794 [Penicillium malachiteum]KAJ5726437.1 hypothetical protein N7483_007794 [Penicillium malachiteum]